MTKNSNEEDLLTCFVQFLMKRVFLFFFVGGGGGGLKEKQKSIIFVHTVRSFSHCFWFVCSFAVGTLDKSDHLLLDV